MPDAFPLDWPQSWPRTPWDDRRRSRFKKHTIGVQIRDVQEELRKLGASHVVVSTDIEITSYGLVELMWKKKVKEAHPDHGGSQEEMTRLNRAIADARAALGRPDPVDGVR